MASKFFLTGFRVCAAGAFFALAACSLAPQTQAPVLALPVGWQLSGAAATPQAGPWWRAYHDARLEGLVADALAYNDDIMLAQARVAEARAISGYASASRMPEVDAGATAGRGEAGDGMAPLGGKPSDTLAVGALLSFEVDLWGRLANADRAAREQLLAQEANARTVALGVTAETVAGYFAIVALDRQLDITAKTIATRQKSYDLERKRLDRGDADALVVRQAQAQLMAAQARKPVLEQQRAQRFSALSVLLGRSPADIMAGAAFAGATDLPALPALPQRDASEVVVARPDIIAAEHALQAAGANVGVARAAYLPRLSLQALLGALAGNLDGLLDNSARIWSTGATATVPLLDFGRARAQIDAAQAREKQAYIAYGKTVRMAFREIRDALTARDKTAQLLDVQEKQAAVLRDAAGMARRRFDAGYSSYMDVLDAERGLFDAEMAVVEARRLLLQSSVDLYKALGGGE